MVIDHERNTFFTIADPGVASHQPSVHNWEEVSVVNIVSNDWSQELSQKAKKDEVVNRKWRGSIKIPAEYSE